MKTRKVVVEDDEEDATIEEEAEDGIGSRDRSTSSDTKLMRNGGIVAKEGGGIAGTPGEAGNAESFA